MGPKRVEIFLTLFNIYKLKMKDEHSLPYNYMRCLLCFFPFFHAAKSYFTDVIKIQQQEFEVGSTG